MGLLSKAAVTPVSKTPPSPAKTRAFIDEYGQSGHPFHCIVLRADAQKLRSMVPPPGAVDALSCGSLILLPRSVDRELFAHRLSKSLNAEILFQCAADSGAAAFKAIVTFL